MVAAVVYAGAASAATITWSAPLNITSDTDVSTAGTLVRAANLTQSGNAIDVDVTVNGVTFKRSPYVGTTTTLPNGDIMVASDGSRRGAFSGFGGADAAPFNTLSSVYQTLLSSGIYNDGDYLNPTTTARWTVTLTNLTVGGSYQLQVWVSDYRLTNLGQTNSELYTTVSDGVNSVNLEHNTTNILGGIGQYVIGTFVADATTQVFTYTGGNAPGVDVDTVSCTAVLNAYQLRDLACVGAGVSNGPVNTSAAVGQTVQFSTSVTGASPVIQWQVSTDNGTTWNNVSSGTGANTATYTTAPTAQGNSGSKYRCVVNVACNSSSVTSAVATLTVVVPKNITWVGGGANLWNTTTPNWSGDATLFSTSDRVAITDVGNNSSPLDLVGAITPSAVLVSNATKDFVIGSSTSGYLNGQFDLTKAGSGKLTLTTDSQSIGKTFINGGKLSVDSGSRLGVLPGVVTPDFLTLAGGSLEVSASTNINATRGITLATAGGGYSVPAAIVCTNQSVITGAGSLTKLDDGTLVLAALNNFSGNLVVNGGIVSGPVTGGANNGAYVGVISPFGAVTNTRSLIVNNGGVLSFDIGNTFAGGNTTTPTIAPNIIVNQGGTLRTRVSDGNNLGLITMNGGVMDLGNGHSSGNYGAAIFTDTVTVGGAVPSVITNTGTANSFASLGYRNCTNGIVFNIADVTGNADPDLIISAPLRNAAGGTVVDPTNTSLVKIGTGNLRLDGVNTYSGLTVISNGTLSGNGTITGPVLVTANGNLAPGSSIGTMTIYGSLTLGGSYTAELDNTAAPNCDQVTGMSSVTLGGTLVLANRGPALTTNDTFQLFSASAYSGVFTSISPFAPGAGLAWDTSTLASDGILRITTGSGVNPTPTNIVASVVGGNYMLVWPQSHIGWTLQMQTNSLAVGLSTNWVNISGSEVTNRVFAPISLGVPTAFFRLKLNP